MYSLSSLSISVTDVPLTPWGQPVHLRPPLSPHATLLYRKTPRNTFRDNSVTDVPLTPWGQPVHLRPPLSPHATLLYRKTPRNTFRDNSVTDVLLT